MLVAYITVVGAFVLDAILLTQAVFCVLVVGPGCNLTNNYSGW